MLSKYFRNVIPHPVVAAPGPHFHLAQCRQMEWGSAVVQDGEERVEVTPAGVSQRIAGVRLQLAPQIGER